MDRFEDMAIFVAVVEEHGFAAAARRLNMSPPSVTRSVANLEAHIGSLLLTRNTRSAHLTESGQRYFVDCRRILGALKEAAEVAAGVDAPPRGLLTITAPVLFGERFITPIVVEFLDKHPQMNIKTLFLDRVVNLVDEGIDVAVRIAQPLECAEKTECVGKIRRVVCAAPSLLQRAGIPLHPNDLRRFRLINSVTIGDWCFLDGDKPLTLEIDSPFTVNSNQAAINAATLGWGVTRVMSYQVADQLAADQLKIVLSEFELPAIPIHIVCSDNHKTSTKIRHFVDFCTYKLRNEKSIN